MNREILLAGKLRNEHFSNVVAKTLKGVSKKRTDAILSIVAERLSGRMVPQYVSERQAEASQLLEYGLDIYLKQTGEVPNARFPILDHPSYMVAVEPSAVLKDGVGGVIIRPHSIVHHHMNFLLTGEIPVDELSLIRAFLWVTGAKWCDYASFCPFFPEETQIKVLRVYAGPDVVEFARECVDALNQVESYLNQLSTALDN